MTYKIPIPKNFSFQECLWFLDRDYDDCLHEVRPNVVRKPIFIDNVPTLIEITENDNQLIINVLIGNFSEKEIIEFVKDWFDFDRDKVGFIFREFQNWDAYTVFYLWRSLAVRD